VGVKATKNIKNIKGYITKDIKRDRTLFSNHWIKVPHNFPQEMLSHSWSWQTLLLNLLQNVQTKCKKKHNDHY